MNSRSIVCLSLLIVVVWNMLPAQVRYTQKVTSYNLWNYRGTSTSDNDREDDFRVVIVETDPDLLVVQELENSTGYTHFLEDVLNHDDASRYEGASFSNQSNTDIDIALYFRSGMYKVISTGTVNTTSSWGHRDAVEFVVRHLPSGQELGLYGVHLKAGNSNSDAADRLSEASKLRAYLNELDAGGHFLVLGDFNVYDGDEAGFQRLVESQDDNDGRLFDPINQIGAWHNNSSFASIHTQATRASYGGMDDRFDFILASGAVLNASSVNYVEGSYTAFGNDGTRCCNEAINSGTNGVVSASVADALHNASDHLPVVMRIEFIGAGESEHTIVINEIMKNPSAVSDASGEWFELYNGGETAVDLCGWTIKDDGTDEFTIKCDDSFVIAAGDYVIFAPNSDTASNGGFSVNYAYTYGSFKLANGNDEIILLDVSGGEADRVEYDTSFPDPTGASMALIDPSADNSDGANWNVSTLVYGAGDGGTPGQNNSGIAVITSKPLPQQYKLHQNYPNPFNAVTTIPFTMAERGEARIAIFNLDGREMVELVRGDMSTGEQTVTWDASEFPSGLYICRLETQGGAITRKLLLLK
ncbi:MAG: lamin tail domain-containing protein [Candidatus Neomarinimicrobiota bacterium]|nr:lamin tail domain-containing protein [Candidatus Neomarinimicrobiota bacterium]